MSNTTSPYLAQQGLGTVPAAGLNNYVQTFQSTSQLRSFTGTPGMSVLLLGVAQANDGLGGIFYWNALGTQTDDNLNYIQPTGSAGQWWRDQLWNSTSTGTQAFFSAATPGGVSTNQIYGPIACPSTTVFASGWPNSGCGCTTGPSGNVSWNIYAGLGSGGTLIGSCSISAGQTSGSVTGTGGQVATAGSIGIFTLVAQSTDAVLQNFYFGLRGTYK